MSARNKIVSVIDWFYPPFRRLMPLQTFRYAACGGANMLFDIFIYFISYNFLLHKQIVYLPLGLAIQPYIAAFIIAFLFSFPSGFFLMRYVVFPESNLRRRTQLGRYFVQVMTCLMLNYVFIKALVEYGHIYPTIAKIITTGLLVTFSFLAQKYFTFKVKQQ